MTYTLVSEGSSDAVLVWILEQLLIFHGDAAPMVLWANPYYFPPGQGSDLSPLADKMLRAIRANPASALFVHRDADDFDPTRRLQEISEAAQQLHQWEPIPCICVVPIQEMEAWLMVDHDAIRKGCGVRRSGKRLSLPPIGQIERTRQPKEKLADVLAEVVSGRSVPKNVKRLIVEQMDWTKLRRLSAFQRLENDVQNLLRQME